MTPAMRAAALERVGLLAESRRVLDQAAATTGPRHALQREGLTELAIRLLIVGSHSSRDGWAR